MKVFGSVQKFNILTLSVAAALQAKLPNPTWMMGVVIVDYDILGGLVSGSINVEATFGEECNIIQDPSFETVPVIKQITPEEGSSNLSVAVKPVIEYYLPLNQEYGITDINTGEEKYLRAIHHDVTLRVVNGNTIILSPGEGEQSEDGLFRTITPFDLLKGNTDYELIASVRYQKKDAQTNQWIDVLDDNGEVITEADTTTFSTGPDPTTFLTENLKFTYPIDRQLNMYKDFSTLGILETERPQRKLVDFIPDGYKPYARFSLVDGTVVAEVELIKRGGASGSYAFGQRVEFNIPNWILNNSTIYKLEIVVHEEIDDSTGNGGDVNIVGGFLSDIDVDPRQVTELDIKNQIMSQTGVTDEDLLESMIQAAFSSMKEGIIRDTTRNTMIQSPIEVNYTNTKVNELINEVMFKTQLPDSRPMTEYVVIDELGRAKLNNIDGDGYLNPVQYNAQGDIIIPGGDPLDNDPGWGDPPSATEYGVERVLYCIHFRTSEYNTFADKMGSISLGNAAKMSDESLEASISGQELFDYFELQYDEKAPFISYESLDNSWMNSTIKPLLYDLIPISQILQIRETDLDQNGAPYDYFENHNINIGITNRNTLIYDIPPKHAALIKQENNSPKLLDSEIAANNFAGYGALTSYLDFLVPKIVLEDFNHIQTKCTAEFIKWFDHPDFITGIEPQLINFGIIGLKNAVYLPITNGVYPIEFIYKIGGRYRKVIINLQY